VSRIAHQPVSGGCLHGGVQEEESDVTLTDHFQENKRKMLPLPSSSSGLDKATTRS
jgi:hypothetical protein